MTTHLQRCECLPEDEVPSAGGEHGRQERQAGQRRQVALGRVVEEHAVAGGAAQQGNVHQVGNVKPCRDPPDVWSPAMLMAIKSKDCAVSY